MESSSLTPLFEESALRAALAMSERPQQKITIRPAVRARDEPNHIRSYVPPFLAPASNGNREVARRARQIAAGKLRVTHVD